MWKSVKLYIKCKKMLKNLIKYSANVNNNFTMKKIKIKGTIK